MTMQQTTLGLAVAWVDPDGPAANELAATDIVEAVNGQAVGTADDWRARVRNIARGDEVKLRVRSEGGTRDVAFLAAAVVELPEDPSLGLRVRTVLALGVEVLGVDPRSRADRAGIRQGDLITVVGRQKIPTAAHVTRMFDALPRGDKMLVALTRGDEHHVVVLEEHQLKPDPSSRQPPNRRGAGLVAKWREAGPRAGLNDDILDASRAAAHGYGAGAERSESADAVRRAPARSHRGDGTRDDRRVRRSQRGSARASRSMPGSSSPCSAELPLSCLAKPRRWRCS